MSTTLVQRQVKIHQSQVEAVGAAATISMAVLPDALFKGMPQG